MTKDQIILQKKATALNAIRKIYNKHNYNTGRLMRNNHWDDSWPEQRDQMVKEIMDKLEKELQTIKSENNGNKTDH